MGTCPPGIRASGPGCLPLGPRGAEAPDPEQGFFLELCVPEKGPTKASHLTLVEATLAVTSNK